MIREHFRLTASMNALSFLQTWDEAKKQFKKVIPIEYKAVLEKKKSKVSSQIQANLSITNEIQSLINPSARK
jgi:glutamate synthase domain-containing protein 3